MDTLQIPVRFNRVRAGSFLSVNHQNSCRSWQYLFTNYVTSMVFIWHTKNGERFDRIRCTVVNSKSDLPLCRFGFGIQFGIPSTHISNSMHYWTVKPGFPNSLYSVALSVNADSSSEALSPTNRTPFASEEVSGWFCVSHLPPPFSILPRTTSILFLTTSLKYTVPTSCWEVAGHVERTPASSNKPIMFLEKRWHALIGVKQWEVMKHEPSKSVTDCHFAELRMEQLSECRRCPGSP